MKKGCVYICSFGVALCYAIREIDMVVVRMNDFYLEAHNFLSDFFYACLLELLLGVMIFRRSLHVLTEERVYSTMH